MWWLSIEAKRMGDSVRSRGNGWWRWMGGGGLGCDEWHRKVAAAEPTGVEEDGYHPSNAGRGGAMGVAWGRMGAWRSSGTSLNRRSRLVPWRPWIRTPATAVL